MENFPDKPYPLSPEMMDIHNQSLIMADIFQETYGYNDMGARVNWEEAHDALETYIDLRRSLPVIGTDESGRNLHWGFREAVCILNGIEYGSLKGYM